MPPCNRRSCDCLRARVLALGRLGVALLGLLVPSLLLAQEALPRDPSSTDARSASPAAASGSLELPAGSSPAPTLTDDPPTLLDGALDAVERRVLVGAFADLGFVTTESGKKRDFQIGQLVLHGTVDLPRGFGAFTELTINSSPTWETRVERVLLTWEWSDALKLSLGRHHLPVTWWNATYHHGLWLQTTARRPLMIGYSDALIPNHAVGLMAEGLVPFWSALGLRFHLSVNGGGDDHKHTAAGAKERGRLAGTAGLFLEPPSLPALRLGAVAYWDPHRVRSGKHVAETLVGAHAIWSDDRPEVAAEWVLVHHRAQDAATPFLSHAAYVQLAWRLSGSGEPFKPYVRHDRMRLDGRDPTLQAVVSQDLWTFGLRWDVASQVALRVEGARRIPVQGAATWDALLQVSATW